ncbi:SDR family NAD(P)-dependent oxidoreductase, partial [Streptomyces sp. NPDC047315]|uniref:SDR family NAD(P)-dependent oxidoreductase n=1 Tax=Streptomyces sp. NPDC047315 TaxID=3155142 RepID=UPI0034102F3E
HGTDVDWRAWFTTHDTTTTPHTTDLPTYAFQRHRYWLEGDGEFGSDPEGLGLVSSGHPLLGAAVELAGGDTRVLTGRLTAGRAAWLADHRIGDAVLIPGAALVEWALRAADEAGCGTVDELVLQAPLLLPSEGGVRVQVAVDAVEGDGRRKVRIYSRQDGADAPAGAADDAWLCHAEGVLGPDRTGMETARTGAWPPAGAEAIDVQDFYARTEAAGYGYGPAFQGVRAAWRDGADLLAEVELPDEAGDADAFGVHPALLDAALHPVFLLGQAGEGQVWLPFSWGGVTLHAVGARTVRVLLTPRGERLDQGLRLTVADPAGAPVLTAESVVMRPAQLAELSAARTREVTGLYRVEWAALAPAVGSTVPEAAPYDGEWAVLGGRSPADSVAGTNGFADFAALVAALGTGTDAPSVAVALPADVETQAQTRADGAEDADRALAAVTETLDVLRAWLAEPRLTNTPLVIVTRCAAAVDDETPAPAAAAVWGLVRSAQQENPDRFVLLDTDSDTGTDAPGIDAIRHAVTSALAVDEPQLALRDGRVLVPRLTRAGGALLPPDRGPWRLGLRAAGSVDGIDVVAAPEADAELADGEVRIAVGAAGVNFRDVLIALGMYPGGADVSGSEGAGRVVEVGPGVTELAAGDRVMGVFDGAFGPLAVADARMLVRPPDGWTDEQAASVPVNFLTAWFGLVELGGLRAGESVLVHSATGGVGTAAVQIARHLGAEVFATASPAKHAALEAMGVDAAHRASSRDLDFEDAFREATGGRGVDVVLNSLAGEFTDASLRTLADGGRFVEMGKTDVRDPDEVKTAHPGTGSYRAFDLVPDAGPTGIGRMLKVLRELFEQGVLAPAPVRSWPLAQGREAFRYLSGARHVGKVVLRPSPGIDDGATVLVSGGTGTLGGLVAEHLVRGGVRHMVLTGRRGAAAPGVDGLVERLTQLGASVRVEAVDMADPTAVKDVVEGIGPEHPLAGVVHAAGVVDDGVVSGLSAQRLAGVWGAKAAGAFNLHRATEHLPLTMFVVLSSAAGTLGSAGQANYAAANAFCDALIAHRRAAGLAGNSVGWGLWAEASGMAGGLTGTDLARMARTGFRPISTPHGLALFDASLARGDAHLVALDLDPRALPDRSDPALPVLLRTLAAGAAPRRTAATRQAPGDLADRLAALPVDGQRQFLLDLVRTNAAAVLGHADAATVRADASFKELGFDSLTVVELRNRLAAATGLRLPASLVFDYVEAGLLAEHLRERLAPDATATTGDPVDPLLGELGRIEATLTALELDDGARGRLARRLTGLLSAVHAAPAAEGADGPVGFDDVESATDDEIFELIDREL